MFKFINIQRTLKNRKKIFWEIFKCLISIANLIINIFKFFDGDS